MIKDVIIHDDRNVWGPARYFLSFGSEDNPKVAATSRFYERPPATLEHLIVQEGVRLGHDIAKLSLLVAEKLRGDKFE
jgi:hypothetical protein